MADIATVKSLLRKMSPSHTPMIQGIHGTGKTEVVRQLCAEPDGWNLRCCELQGSQLSDVGDLIGLQKIIEYEEEVEVFVDGKPVKTTVKRQETAWIPPYWFPKDGKPFCLFLDEINRAAPPIKRAMMQIGNDHRLLNFELPEGSRVVCAINPDNEGNYDVEEFDDAENDRYWKILFTPTIQEWIFHARKIGVLDCIISYIEAHEEDLDPYAMAGKVKTKGSNDEVDQLGVKQSRRSWVRLSKDMVRALEIDPDAYSGPKGNAELRLLAAGWVGEAIAQNFASWYQQHGAGLQPNQIIEADPSDKKIWAKLKKMGEAQSLETLRLGSAICGYLQKVEDKLVEKSKPTEYGKLVADNWYKFLTSIPKEVAAQVNMQGVEAARKQNQKDPSTCKWVARLSAINEKVCDFYIDLADYDV